MYSSKHSLHIITTQTVSNQFVHAILILAEYFFSIFPYVLSSSYKLVSTSGTLKKTDFEEYFMIFSKLKSNLLGDIQSFKDLLSSLYFLAVILIEIFGFIFYFTFIFFYQEKIDSKMTDCFEKIFANFFNLFFFRYLSFILIDLTIYPFVYTYLKDHDYGFEIISYVLIIVFIFYVYNCFLFIQKNSLYITISNKLISSHQLFYPFDSFSLRYDRCMLLMKIVSAVDSNHISINNYSNSILNSFTSLLLLVISLYMVTFEVFEKKIQGFYSIDSLTNFNLNYIRKFIIIFNFLMILFTIIVDSKNRDIVVEILCFCLCILLSIGAVSSKWFLFVKRDIIHNSWQNVSSDLICFLLSKSYKNHLSDREVHKENSKSSKPTLSDELFSSLSVNYQKCMAKESSDKIKKAPDFDEKSYYTTIYRFYKIKLKEKAQNYCESSEDQLIKYFLSKIRGNAYKIYKYYYQIREGKLYSKDSIKNLVLSIELEALKSSHSETYRFFLKVIALSKLAVKIKNHLKEFKEIINNRIEVQTAERYISYAEELYKLRKSYMDILPDNITHTLELKSLINSKSKSSVQNQRNAVNSFRYDVILVRYLIEVMSNKQFETLGRFSIEFFEEFLGYNFSHSSYMILSSSLNHHNPHKQKSSNQFRVISFSSSIKKVGGKALDDYFPDKFRKEGNEKLLKIVRKLKLNASSEFEFVFNVNKYIEHFIYQFDICQSLRNTELILFGNFSSLYDSTIVLEITDLEEINIVGYSNDLTKTLLINSTIFEKIKQHRNFICPIGFFFDKVTISSKVERDEKRKKTRVIKDYSLIECKLNYPKFYTRFVTFLERTVFARKKSEDSTYIQSNVHELRENLNVPFNGLLDKIEKAKIQFKKQRVDTKFLILEKIFDLNQRTFLYNVTVTNSRRKAKEDSGKMKTTIKPKKRYSVFDAARRTSCTGKEMAEGDFYLSNFNDFASVSSANSAKDTLSVTSTNAIQQEEYIKRNLISQESKFISTTSLLNFFLNSIVIILCIIFLYLQITETNKIKGSNKLYFDFRTLRISFSNVFFNIISMSCTHESLDIPIENKCKNKFFDFWERYEKEMNFTDYAIADYIGFELVEKINSLKSYYLEFKTSLYQPEYREYISLLSNEVALNLLEQEDNNVVAYKKKCTFDEAIQLTINDHFSILNIGGEGNFTDVAYPLVNVIGFEYDFSLCGSKNFNHYQHSLFNIFANFVYFGVTFNLGEKLLLERYSSLNKTNQAVIITFMLIFVSLNLALFVICFISLKTGAVLFKKLTINFSIKISEQLYNNYLNKKIDNLLIISDFYSKNPVEVIQKAEEDTLQFQKAYKKKNNVHEKKEINKELEDRENHQKELFNHLSKTKYPMHFFYSEYIKSLFVKTGVLTFLYLILIATLDIFLFNRQNSLTKYRDYVRANYNFQLYGFASVGLVHLIHVFNVTEHDLAAILQITEYEKEDGAVNVYIRNLIDGFSNMLILNKLHNFAEQTDYYPVDCERVYEIVKDSIFEKFHQERNLTNQEELYKLQKITCRKFQFDTGAYFLYEKYMTELHSLHNRFLDRNFKGISGIYNDEFYKIYLYLYFYIRPMKTNFDLSILYPAILDKFQSYVTFVWIYLVINILVEGIIFCINKLVIFNELDKLKRNFFHFGRCVE